MGSGDVVSVVGIAVAYDFRIDFRVSCLSVLIFLQNQDTGALSQNKAIPPLVKGNRGPLGSKQKNRNAITENIRSTTLSRDMESQYLLINTVQKWG